MNDVIHLWKRQITKGRDRKLTYKDGQRPHSQSLMSLSFDLGFDLVVTGGQGGFSTCKQGEQGWKRWHRIKRRGQSSACAQWERTEVHNWESSFQKNLFKEKTDYTEKYWFKWLIFVIDFFFINLFSSSSFVLKCPHWSVLHWLELQSRGGRSVLLRLEGRPPVWWLWVGLLELLCICMKWRAWCQDMDHSFTPSNEYRLHTG